MRWTIKRLDAAIQACEAMLASEEGKGDAEGISFDDLQAASDMLKEQRSYLEAKRNASLRKAGIHANR